MAANIFAFFAYVIVGFFMARSDLLPIATTEREKFGDISEIPLYLGIVIFATSAVSIVIPLQNEMENPKSFTKRFGTLNIAYSLVVVTYAAIGTMGYLKYGDCVHPTITLNLPNNEA